MRHSMHLVATLSGTLLASYGSYADEPQPQSGLWNYSNCSTPRFGPAVLRKRTPAYATLLFDISLDGHPENIRVTKSSPGHLIDKAARKAIKRWQYFAYIEDGELKPRKDVAITFTYGDEPIAKDASCTHTPWPEGASHEGDPTDPFIQLKRCRSLILPRAAARNHLSATARVRYDISPEGNTINLKLIEVNTAKPEIFEQPALAAVSRWRYAPFLKKGETQTREGLEVTLNFGDLPSGAVEHPCSYASWESTNQISLVIEKTPGHLHGIAHDNVPADKSYPGVASKIKRKK